LTAAATFLDGAYGLLRPAFFRMDPERAHELVLDLLALSSRAPRPAVPVVRRLLGVNQASDPVEAFGLRFRNRVGLAAGLDKNALALPAWTALGFGHVEIGTVTPLPQVGNPRPRVFRLPTEQGLINRMGFPNQGSERIAQRLCDWRASGRTDLVLGGNIGKGRDTALEDAPADYAAAAKALAPSVDYLAVNVSSPNTPGLRTLQGPEQITSILAAVKPVSTRPVLVKLAPDLELDSLPDIVAAARQAGAAGFIATNTTIQRDTMLRPSQVARETGGLSGKPLVHMALKFTQRLVELAGPELPVISAGGIGGPDDVRRRLDAGAVLVQVYTALIYKGPGLAARLVREGLPAHP
jgi:dihydroorotate dehydrogenase